MFGPVFGPQMNVRTSKHRQNTRPMESTEQRKRFTATGMMHDWIAGGTGKMGRLWIFGKFCEITIYRWKRDWRATRGVTGAVVPGWVLAPPCYALRLRGWAEGLALLGEGWQGWRYG